MRQDPAEDAAQKMSSVRDFFGGKHIYSSAFSRDEDELLLARWLKLAAVSVHSC